MPRGQLRATVARLLRVLPVAGQEQDGNGKRAIRPIGVLQGLAQRVGGAVSETAGIDREPPAAMTEMTGQTDTSAAATDVDPRPTDAARPRRR